MQRDHKDALGVRADPSRLFHFMFKLSIGIKEIESKQEGGGFFSIGSP